MQFKNITAHQIPKDQSYWHPTIIGSLSHKSNIKLNNSNFYHCPNMAKQINEQNYYIQLVLYKPQFSTS